MEGKKVCSGKKSSESTRFGDGLTVRIYKNSNKDFFSEHDGEKEKQIKKR